MGRLPIKDKNAYIAIHISRNEIRATLSYAHYDIGRAYNIDDQTMYDREKDPIGEGNFWREYFDQLEKKFNWNIIDPTSRYTLGQVVDFVDEGEGVAGMKISIHSSVNERSQIVAAIHTYLPTIKIEVVETHRTGDLLRNLSKRMKFDDVLFINMDLSRFDAFRLVKDKSKKKSEGDEENVLHTKIDWDSKNHLVDSIRDSRLKAFSTMDLDNLDGMNVWANYIFSNSLNTSNKVLMDIIRSFITVQLMSMQTNSKAVFKNFGAEAETKKTALIVSGNLMSCVEDSETILALIDGLQLEGSFDIYLDEEDRMFTLGSLFAEGINSSEYIVPRDLFMNRKYRTMVTDMSGFKKGKVVFAGNLVAKDVEIKPVYALAGEIQTIPLNEHIECSVNGDLGKGVGVRNFKGELTIESTVENRYQGLVIDGRDKPVVYGPNHRSNVDKFKGWIKN